MQPHEAARLLDIHPNTVRTWTSDKRYKRFFSDTAQGGDGSARDLTDDDIRVLHYIDQMKDRGLRADEVEASLEQAQAQGFDRLPMPSKSDAVVPTPVIPVQAADQAVIAERRLALVLQERIEELKQERDTLLADRERSNNRIEDLNIKLAKAEMELDLWRAGRLQRSEGGF